ncbi:MAG: phosphatidylglycerophosphatase A [Desulfobacteraceae bacterium]|nr:phosphatidylglycerophosphatase A [Desulfobacteraceae bacterium]
MRVSEKLIILGATGFGLGRIPVAPGTFGTLAAIPLIWLMTWMNPGLVAFFLVSLILLSVYVADKAEIIMGEKDPGSIVIDEIAGFCVTMTLVPLSWLTIILGFIAFRCFDILKPVPVKYFENKFSGGAGIVLDDIMAGVLAALVLKFLYILGLF